MNAKLRFIAAALLGSALAGTSVAAVTDIAASPLITSSPQEVKPNLMLILDDSGSMQWTFMPDDARQFDAVGNSSAGTPMYGYRSSQCNGVYYNPAIKYNPPVNSLGVAYANSSFTNAWTNGFDTAVGTVNLSTSFRAYTTADNWYGSEPTPGDDPVQAAHYYRYSGTQNTEVLRTYTNSASTFYQECFSAVGAAPGSGVFTRVNVSATSGTNASVGADERTNFANWYSFYRTRMLMMKTATGLAFKTIDDDYRVGYMALTNNATPSFLNINTFDATQKASWYSALYGAVANSGTPLRPALSDAGRIYAGTLGSVHGITVNDPVQYSCQKNFAILSTDGYWNGNAGVQIDGTTAIGEQDRDEPRPFTDGGATGNIYVSTLTVGNPSGTSTIVSGLTVGGQQILSQSAQSGSGGGKTSNLAAAIAARINACTTVAVTNCTVAGYRATVSGSTVTIRAPAAITATPAATISSGTLTVSAGAFGAQSTTIGGASDSLADVAMYYYSTDLRADEDNVQSSTDDPANWQHMTTFTLGLGARGSMVYSSTYLSDTSGDYFSVKTGAAASSTVCTWQAAGTVCNWPVPAADAATTIDDLWHAAVNGRGKYFSARDPAALAGSLEDALNTISAYKSASATAATSNPNVTNGDNFRFLTTFTSSEWTGQIQRYSIDLTTGRETGTATWSAKELLDTNTARTLYTYSTATTNRLKPFTWTDLTAGEQAYFSVPWISANATPVAPLTQFCTSGDTCLSGANQSAASGAPLVNFLRGDRTNEGTNFDLSKYFRLRTAVLGDMVSSRATYIKVPRYLYSDSGYAAFRSGQSGRAATLYVGANDGMLHAFNAESGVERWGYIPSMVLPNLFKLADKRYPTNHVYSVDGSPIDADVYFGGAWHTIVVGGLNRGGRGYYALDVTDPDNPKALWEFTHANMGYSFGRPEVVKLKNGTWVVLVTSGYNNTTGDGRGYLYVLDAATGALINTIGTGVGSTTTPSGLAQIRAWVENGAYNNTTTRVYGGDLLGNVWRFDVNGDMGGAAAYRMVTLTGPSGAAQPITTKPELGKVGGTPVVFVGTGRSLGVSDIYDASVQSIYGIKESLGFTSLPSPRSGGSLFVKQTLSTSSCPSGQTFCTATDSVRASTNNAVSFSTNNGWYVDLPAARERADTDPQLAYGVLAIATNAMTPSACEVGGNSFVNFINYKTGGALDSAGGIVSIARQNLSTELAFSIVTSSDGSRKLVATSCQSDGTCTTGEPPKLTPATRALDRTSWRELSNEQ